MFKILLFNFGVIDAHAHLQEEPLRNKLDEIIENAKKENVNIIVNASVDLKDAIKSLNLLSDKKEVKITIGLAPYSNLVNIDKMMKLIEENLDKIVGIGEIGLDYKNGKDERQIKIFKKQALFAKEHGLPVVIHSRSAGKYAIELLEKWRIEKAQLHSFDGSVKYARKAFDLGYYFSLPLTTIKVEQKKKILKEIPLDLLLFETDSPVQNIFNGYNEPKNVKYVYEFASEFLGIKFNKLEKIVEKNYKKLYSD